MRVVQSIKKYVLSVKKKRWQLSTLLHSAAQKKPGVLKDAGSRSVTATEKKFTVKQTGSSVDGVLFLTAGYGTRAEPLSIPMPKCLLPFGETTILGKLIDQFRKLDPPVMAFNASRCPEVILSEVSLHWKGRTELLFEERPLGAAGTLARNHELLTGTWIVCNTDFAMDVPVTDLTETHFSSGSSWTVLTGDMPEKGHYGSLRVNGEDRHYMGISVVNSEIPQMAYEKQIYTGFFSALRKAAEESGMVISEYFTGSEWLDMGETELFREHTLALGSYVHPTASVDPGAILQGCYSVGPYCIIQADALVKNSVLLKGSQVLSGASVVNSVLPAYFCKEP